MTYSSESSATVIIPTLNEYENIRLLVSDLRSQTGVSVSIIIADGGSTDGTLNYTTENNIQVIHSAAGRATQMNQAACIAKSELLLFLHADTRLPENTTLSHALVNYNAERADTSGILAGHFPIRFHRKVHHKHTLFWRYAEEKTATNRPDTINGDQGLLISQKDFRKLGGFDETLHFLEDQKIADAIFSNGKWIVLPGYIITSARRFETEGEHRLYILMSIIMGLFKTGFNDFFTLAPTLYRQQKHTEKLYLTPFFKLIWKIKYRNLGLKNSVLAWYRIGKYVRSHSWQMFYFFDQALRPLYRKKIYPLLRMYDNFIHKLLDHRLGNIITMLLVFTWFMGVLQPIFWILERNELNSNIGKTEENVS